MSPSLVNFLSTAASPFVHIDLQDRQCQLVQIGIQIEDKEVVLIVIDSRLSPGSA